MRGLLRGTPLAGQFQCAEKVRKYDVPVAAFSGLLPAVEVITN